MDNSRRILIASSRPVESEALSEAIRKLSPGAQIFTSVDGTDAAFKLSNAKHHLAVLAMDLPRKSGVQLTEWILGERKFEPMPVVLLSPIPDHEHFVEDVVSGRVQFLASPDDSMALEKCVTRALNYYYHGEKNEEFSLRFLAANETLMKEGERADKCYLLTRGRLKAVRNVNGKLAMLGHVNVGEFVGEMAYINGEPRTADVIAESASEMIEIPFERLDHVLFQRPLWSKALMKTLSRRLKSANDRRYPEDS